MGIKIKLPREVNGVELGNAIKSAAMSLPGYKIDEAVEIGYRPGSVGTDEATRWVNIYSPRIYLPSSRLARLTFGILSSPDFNFKIEADTTYREVETASRPFICEGFLNRRGDTSEDFVAELYRQLEQPSQA